MRGSGSVCSGRRRRTPGQLRSGDTAVRGFSNLKPSAAEVTDLSLVLLRHEESRERFRCFRGLFVVDLGRNNLIHLYIDVGTGGWAIARSFL